MVLGQSRKRLLCFLLIWFMFDAYGNLFINFFLKPYNLSIVMTTGTKLIEFNLTLIGQLVCLFKNLLVNQLHSFKLGEAKASESNVLFLNCLSFYPLSHLQSNSCSLVYCFTTRIEHEKTPSRYPRHYYFVSAKFPIVVVFITITNCVFNY